uniref:Uncharacterized protein n=1 Tax=Panagrolaimus superbus TaxID=310955 RepID=A0A914Y072_9BILA
MEMDTDETRSFQMPENTEKGIDENDSEWKSCGFSLPFCTVFLSITLALKSIVYAAIAIFNGNIPIFLVTAACVPLCIFPFFAISKNNSKLINPLFLVIAILVSINFGGTIYFLIFKGEGWGLLFKILLVVVTLVLAILDVSSFMTANKCKKLLDHRRNALPT